MQAHLKQDALSELEVRVRDLEKEVEHALFLLRESRRLRLCDRCADALDTDLGLGERYPEKDTEE